MAGKNSQRSGRVVRFALSREGSQEVAIRLLTRLTPFGHVGLFPEQVENWRWLFERVRRLRRSDSRRIGCLNLFAYTGGATLAMAAAGGHVVHIDASNPAIKWARRNALLSGLDRCPIRWIAEDAFKFLEREWRRGRRYEVIVLDPPGYGHSPKGVPWKLENRWEELIEGCLRIIRPDRGAAILWTAHSPRPEIHEVTRAIESRIPDSSPMQNGRLTVASTFGCQLDQGYFVRKSWSA